MTQPRIEPWSLGPLANTLPKYANVIVYKLLTLGIVAWSYNCLQMIIISYQQKTDFNFK